MTARDQLNAAIDSYTAAITPPPAPAPVDPKPWAVPITPDPSARWKAVQTALKVTADGLVGNGTLTAIEKALNVVQPAPAPTPAPTPVPSSSWFFPDTTFWRQDISAAPLHPNSAAIAAQIVDQVHRNWGTVVLNSKQYTPRIFIASPGDPRVAFTFNDCQGKGYFDAGLRQQFSNVPIPKGFGPAPGTDSEAVIYDPVSHELWEMWEVKQAGSGWSLCWGGYIPDTTKSDGTFPGGYGATATGLPFIGGLITRKEYLAGSIEHAIGVAFTENLSGHCWPAQRDDGGYGSSPNRPKEGQRFRWPKTLPMPGGLSRLEQQIFRAGQKYGLIAWDKSDGATIRGELSPDWEGQEPDIWNLTGLPWGQLQTIAEGWK